VPPIANSGGGTNGKRERAATTRRRSTDMPAGLIGYCDPWSTAPGGSLSFKISSPGGRPFSTSVVRVRHADPNPAGPGMKLLPVPEFAAQTIQGIAQHADPGSSGWAPCPAIPGGAFHVIVNARVLRHFAATECLLALQSADGIKHFAICIIGGEVRLRLADGAETVVPTGIVLAPRRWWSIGVGVDIAGKSIELEVVQLRPRLGPVRLARRTLPLPPAATARSSDWTRLSLAAITTGHATQCFNGQLEAPSLAAGALPDLLALGGALGVDAARALAKWDFSHGITTQAFVDRGPHGLRGELRNLPTRATKGSNWSGREQAWPHAPHEYGAIHFHADDVGDVGWRESLSLRVPETLASGVYALRVENAESWDLIPFYVRPGPDAATRPRVVFLAPTMTYLAYANHQRGNWAGALQARAQAWGAYPNNPDDNPQFGFSTYNQHPDGTGVALSSRRRPVLTLRPGFLTFLDTAGSGLKHFSDDTHLLDWLEAKGIAFDVVTDEDLDEHGIDLIKDYAVLVTGSHPEYHTERMLDALERFRARGGNFCYLGGNGFYWRIARAPHLPYAMEIRRAESGIRAWAAEPGEYYHQLDGTYGGMWRRNGRPPQALAEIGFAVQGLFEGSPYRRTQDSFAPEVAWIFDGVAGDVFGETGFSGGGAGGFELDQVSPHLGTSPGAVILARSEGHGDSFLGVPEDILTHTLNVGGGTSAIEAHMVYAANDAGGQVFSTGSITFIGSLPVNGHDNAVSRILENVLRRFVAGPKG
jgi:N,N-dimethylformamidase beta subunit-like, C-terminal